MELKRLRDSLAEFEAAGTTVLGISMDPVDSHKKFCDDLALPFDLIADPDKKIHAAYGFNGYTRALILVGKDGKIAYVNKKFDLKEEGWAELMKQVEALKPVK
jgi:peroxiredoxin Q/BCP